MRDGRRPSAGKARRAHPERLSSTALAATEQYVKRLEACKSPSAKQRGLLAAARERLVALREKASAPPEPKRTRASPSVVFASDGLVTVLGGGSSPLPTTKSFPSLVRPGSPVQARRAEASGTPTAAAAAARAEASAAWAEAAAAALAPSGDEATSAGGASSAYESEAPSLRDLYSSGDELEESAGEEPCQPIFGSVTCYSMNGRDCPKKKPLIDMRRPSIFSNPFDMGGDEGERDAVFDAYKEWWARGNSTVDEICSVFGVVRANSWSGHELARSPQRLRGLEVLVGIVSNGHDIGIGSADPPTRRSHTWWIKDEVMSRAHAAALAAAKWRLPKSTAPASAPRRRHLVVFSGDKTVKDRLAEQQRRRDPEAEVVEMDIVNDPKCDLTEPLLQMQLLGEIAAGTYVSVHFALPCSSYSVVRGDQLRSKKQPRNMDGVDARWHKYLQMHDGLCDFVAQCIDLLDAQQLRWSLENPSDRGDESSPAYWEEYADWGTVWDQAPIKRAMARGAQRVTLPLCSLGSPFQKYVSVLVPAHMHAEALELTRHLVCKHKSHAEQAVGVDERGQSKAARSAVYPVGFNVLLAKLLIPVERGAAPRNNAAKTHSSSPGQMHVGSSRPHAVDGAADEYQRAERWATSGSLRWLEPELDQVLLDEPLPSSNEPRRTSAVLPPSPISAKPGPFTTEQLIPEAAQAAVKKFGREIDVMFDRARRGANGWREARKLRPEPVTLDEKEALHERGWGFAWQRVDPSQPLTNESLWEVVEPSVGPHDRPCAGAPNMINADHFLELAKKEGYTDRQLLSWIEHGFPGVDLGNHAVLAPPHVGALKEAEAYEKCVERDVEWQFVTAPSEFPQQWPCVLDPCNIVLQNGKPRLTIDKTMWISKRADMPPANLLINLIAEAERAGRLKLVTVGQVARAAAILKSPLKVFAHLRSKDPKKRAQLKMKKHDLKAFFRFHPKQRAHVREQGKVIKGGFSLDLRVNFGERNAPDHTCRESDALAFFSRRELARLDKEYPTVVPELKAFLAHRRGLLPEGKGMAAIEFILDALFFLCYYVDDCGLLTYDDELVDMSGNPVIVFETAADGTSMSKPQRRIDMYGEAVVEIAKYIGHQCPGDKRDEGSDLIFLGITLALQSERRILPRVKALGYKSIAERCIAGRRRMPNGLAVNEYDTVNSLVHRLLHASEVVPLGKQHTFHLRQALKAARDVTISKSRTMHSCIITKAAGRELNWWVHQLEHAGSTGLPLASRYSFPGASSECNLIRYSDASREPDKPASHSGGGAWCVIKNTFYYIHVEWTKEEVLAYSINVLEAHVRDIGGKVFLDVAKSLGLTFTHTTAYVDNTAAECIAENGRASTELMHEMNRLRLVDLQQRDVFETNERIASEDNDVADLISRGDIKEALFYPQDCGLDVIRCEINAAYRQLPTIAA